MTDEIGPRHGRSRSIPKPAHQIDRLEALPGQQQRPVEDDTRAPGALRTILQSASYREADRDLDFLQGDATRGIRLQLDFLKAEALLEEHRVAHTIVVFGGTRIREPQAARRAVDSCATALAADPNDEVLRRRLDIARSVAEKSRYYEIARKFGRIVGAAGEKAIGGRIMIMTGGGPGIMEAANRGAHDVGAKSIGLNIALPREQYPNPYVTPELCFRFHYFAMRKLHFLLRARALVAFPGGYGTMDEVFEVLSLAQTRKIAPVPVILVGESYWRRAFDPEFLVGEGVIDAEDRDLFWFAESAEDAWRDILCWYETAGRPLLPPTASASWETTEAVSKEIES
ncbi:MAG TPA: LOG family protein [Bradyrhizobium sp.]|nr:LOG family protein [Bradyrhizobium sp.]